MSGPPHARWRLCRQDPSNQLRLSLALGVSPMVAQVLINRGLRDVASARVFLDASSAAPASPFDLSGMDRAVRRMARAVSERTPVVVYGDYDADGVTATAILVRALRRAGAAADFYVPDRRTEGYGLHSDVVSRLARRAGLLIAVDCGITALDAADAARAAGLDLIILDHHLPLGRVPESFAVVNPKTGGVSTDYCAAGLAWQAARGLLDAMGHAGRADDLVDLAAVGTVADAVGLLDDNRVIVAHGLRQLEQSASAGIRALIEVAELRWPLGARDISHGLAPRINAAGRLAHASAAVRLLLSDDPGEARAIAADLDRLNAERRALCDQVLADAVDEIETQRLADGPAIVLAREGWHPGVIGIVASQVVERYYRPTVLIAVHEGVGKGSARSIPPLHLVHALAQGSSTLEAFGGHAMAAGLTLRADAVAQFRAAFVATVAGAVAADDLVPVTDVDVEVPLSQVTPQLADEMAGLAPFGAANPEPVFITRGLRAVGTRMVGGGAHLRLVVSDGTRTADAIGFRLGDLAEVLAFTQARVDLAYGIERDQWRQGESVQLVVQRLWTPDVDPAAVTADTGTLLARLDDRADEYLDVHHREIDEAPAFHTKVVGVTFEGRQELLSEVEAGARLRLVRDPTNPHDPHAIKVCLSDGRQLGFLRATLAARLAPAIDAGARYAAMAAALTGGGGRAWGLNIFVEREAAWGGDGDPSGGGVAMSPTREEFVRWVAARVGRGRSLSDDQRHVVDLIRGGGRAAVRLGPGRGLPVTSAYASAALVTGGMGPVALVLPRASDAEAWARVIGPWLHALGVRTRAVHGAQPVRVRASVEGSLERHEVDLLVASASWMVTRDLDAGTLIVVVDDLSHSDDLDALAGRFGDRIRLIAGPASRDRLLEAAATLAMEPLNLLAGPRTNLRVTDHRGAPGVDLPNLTHPRSEKVLVLTAGARESVNLGRRLRRDHPAAADRIAYYHDGLPAALRRVLEDLCSAGALRTLVTGSLLVPPAAPSDIGRVIAAGLLPTRMLAAEALGAAGAEGQVAIIDLRYGHEALDVAAAALERLHPRRDMLVRCYHLFKDHGRHGAWAWPPEGGPDHGQAGMPMDTLNAALGIFLEAGIITAEGGGGAVRYQVTDPAARVDLERSLRYREGVRERAAWSDLRAWAEGPAAAILADLARA